jgi:hypothetical protein
MCQHREASDDPRLPEEEKKVAETRGVSDGTGTLPRWWRAWRGGGKTRVLRGDAIGARMEDDLHASMEMPWVNVGG